MNLIRIFCLIVFVAILPGCSSTPSDEDDPTINLSAAELYQKAQSEIAQEGWSEALDLLQKLEARFPFGAYAQQAGLEMAFVHYKRNDMDLAVAAAERFIKANPRHENIDYAYYLVGLAHYARGDTFISKLLKIDKAERDQSAMHTAFRAFRDLIEKFPDSRYVADARVRMVTLRNRLARQEVNVAEYYIKRGAPVSAINRAKYVVENYSQTPALYDALGLLATTYKKLGMNDLYDDTIAVIKLNFPAHPVLDM